MFKTLTSAYRQFTVIIERGTTIFPVKRSEFCTTLNGDFPQVFECWMTFDSSFDMKSNNKFYVFSAINVDFEIIQAELN